MASVSESILDALIASLGGSARGVAKDLTKLIGFDLEGIGHLLAGARTASRRSILNELAARAGASGKAPGYSGDQLEKIFEAAGVTNFKGPKSRGAFVRGFGLGGTETVEEPQEIRRAGGGFGGGGRGRGTGLAGEPPIGPYEPPRARQPEWSPWAANSILTPQSSNVYSFGYDHMTSTLYVTFKAHELGKDVSISKGRGGRHQLHGVKGKTVGKKTNAPGPMYAYLDVPERVFLRMKLANSKGKFVWDELRVRGSIYGHRYRYQLVTGMLTTHKGESVSYVPRKATRRGFRVRAEVSPGVGRRSFVHSALSAEEGFSTRRSR